MTNCDRYPYVQGVDSVQNIRTILLQYPSLQRMFPFQARKTDVPHISFYYSAIYKSFNESFISVKTGKKGPKHSKPDLTNSYTQNTQNLT